MGEKVVSLAQKLGVDPDLVSLSMRVYVPAHIRVRDGKRQDVDGYWREVSSGSPLTGDEVKAIKAKAREILGPDLKAGMKSPQLKVARREAEIAAVNEFAPKSKISVETAGLLGGPSPWAAADDPVRESRYEKPSDYKVIKGRTAWESSVAKDGQTIGFLRKMSNGYKFGLVGWPENKVSPTYPTRKEALGMMAIERRKS